MSFICGKCFSEMDVDKLSDTRLKIFCPLCGSAWFIDDTDHELNYDDEDDLSIEDAALLWSIHDKSEKYLFGYTVAELENALNIN